MLRLAVFATDDFLPPNGGAEVALGELIKRIPDVSYDVYVANLFPGRPKIEQVGNATIYRVGPAFWKYSLLSKLSLAWFGARKAWKQHKREPYDGIWCMMASWGGLAAESFKRKSNLPLILTLQEGDSLEEIEAKANRAPGFRRLFEQADYLQPIARFLGDWAKRLGYRGAEPTVIPNGVDVARFEHVHSNQERQAMRASFGFPDSSFILSTASRFVKKNGIEDVIRALAKTPSDVCLVLAGFGELESHLKHLVTNLHLESRVRFLGRIDHDRLPLVYQASDAFIRPSLSEGLGNAFLEAMACRIPVIATPVGGILDFLIDQQTGFFCQPQHPDSIAKTIAEIRAMSAEQRQAIIDRAATMVHERYNWNVIAEEMQSLFQRVYAKS